MMFRANRNDSTLISTFEAESIPEAIAFFQSIAGAENATLHGPLGYIVARMQNGVLETMPENDIWIRLSRYNRG